MTIRDAPDLTDLAMNSSGQIKSSGLDQITLTTNDVVTTDGINVNRTQVLVWGTANYSTPTQVCTAETSVEGLTNWSIVYNNGAGTATNTRITVYAGGGMQVSVLTFSTFLAECQKSSLVLNQFKK
jgi:opacity protein-like surface antigen